MAPLLLLLVLFGPAHSRSEGRSSFVVDEQGRVQVGIEVSFLDVPELCDADLLVEAARRPEMEQRLGACLTKDLPRLVRIQGDGRACPVLYDRFDAVAAPGGGTLKISAHADCSALPDTVVIDWGLFAGGALDHVSIARIEQPHAEPKLAMLSRRASRLTVEIARPRWPFYVGGGAVLLLLLGTAVFIARARKRG